MFFINFNSSKNDIHLTNNCYQNTLNHYSLYEEGNTLSFDQFNEYLHSLPGNLDISHIIPRIKDLVIDSIMSCK